MITARAYAKINWALNITGRRADGYHLLDMVMQSISLHDDMSFEEAGALSLTVDGAIPENAADNLVIRAAKALNAYAGTRHGARIALTKRIPARAGLGGGSADCAAALKALNDLWGLSLSDAILADIGVKLGADVPFCLAGGLARVTGIGESIEPAPTAPSIPLVLVTPGGGLSTAEVFKLWDEGGFPDVRLDAPALVDAVMRRDYANIDRLCANALTAPAVELMPEIAAIMDDLHHLGARTAFMTGSGSTVVGAFDDPDDAKRAAEVFRNSIFTETM